MTKNKHRKKGLVELLARHGIKSTGDSEKDLELAKKFMPKPYGK